MQYIMYASKKMEMPSILICALLNSLAPPLAPPPLTLRSQVISQSNQYYVFLCHWDSSHSSLLYSERQSFLRKKIIISTFMNGQEKKNYSYPTININFTRNDSYFFIFINQQHELTIIKRLPTQAPASILHEYKSGHSVQLKMKNKVHDK